MIHKKILLLLVVMTALLSSCYKPPMYHQTEGNIGDSVEKVREAIQRSNEDALRKVPSLMVNQGLYVDDTPINLNRSPNWLKNNIILRGETLPFSYYAKTILSGVNKNIRIHYQSGLNTALPISVDFGGTIKDGLDQLAAKTGYTYTIHSDDVYWQAFITKTFDVAFMPGIVDYTLGDKEDQSSSSSNASAGGGSGTTVGGSTGSIGTSSIKAASLSVWKDLEDSIKALLSSDGKSIVSQATTTITVSDKPANVALVSQFIRNLNKHLSKQVLVKVQVLDVQLNNGFNFGINWQVVKRGFMGTNWVLNANYGTPISITAPSTTSGLGANPVSPMVNTNPSGYPLLGMFQSDPNHITGVNLLINALETQGKVSTVTEPRVVALNNQVSALQIIGNQSYIQSIQSTVVAGTGGSNGGTVTSQVTPGNVITGLTLYILPKIMGKKVYLQVSADLASLETITPSVVGAGSSGQTTLGLPTTNEKKFNQRSVIASGDTLILSGYKRVNNEANAMQLFGSQALGGRGAQQRLSETVVLITPIILDEAV